MVAVENDSEGGGGVLSLSPLEGELSSPAPPPHPHPGSTLRLPLQLTPPDEQQKKGFHPSLQSSRLGAREEESGRIFGSEKSCFPKYCSSLNPEGVGILSRLIWAVHLNSDRAPSSTLVTRETLASPLHDSAL